MMEVQECKLFFWKLSVCEQLSGRERPGKLECSENIKKELRLQRRPRFAAYPGYQTLSNRKLTFRESLVSRILAAKLLLTALEPIGLAKCCKNHGINHIHMYVCMHLFATMKIYKLL